jgi:hypothetical protein
MDGIAVSAAGGPAQEVPVATPVSKLTADGGDSPRADGGGSKSVVDSTRPVASKPSNLQKFITMCRTAARCFEEFPPEFEEVDNMAEYLVWVVNHRTDNHEKALAILLYCMHEVCGGSYESDDGGDTRHAWTPVHESIKHVKTGYSYWTAKLYIEHGKW